MELSWQNVALGALGLVGTTALTILVTRFVNWALQRRSQLVVEIRVNEMFKARKLADSLKEEMRTAVKSWEEREKLPFWKNDIYTDFFRSEQYLKLSITNRTPKKISGLTMSLDSAGSSLIQIGIEGSLVEVPGRMAVPLGELQPKRTLGVDILTSNLFASVTAQALREHIVITSDEHVRTRYKFPSPPHIEFRDRMRRLAALNIVWIVFVTCCVIAVSMLPGRH